MEFLIYVGIGLLAGILAGLLGIGGGIVTIPCLVLVFRAISIPSASLMHLAIGTSLAAMVFNSFSAFLSHYRKKAVLLSVVRPMGFGIAAGTCLGAYIAKILPDHFLQIFFGIFESLLGIHFLLLTKPPKSEHRLPSFLGLSGIGFGVSTFSTMLGIGGGMVTVPILTHYQVPMKKAIGTSSALSFFITFLGASFFLLFGPEQTHNAERIGYIYLPAFITISTVSFFAAPWGVKLVQILPAAALRRIFGIALIAAGLSMILE